MYQVEALLSPSLHVDHMQIDFLLLKLSEKRLVDDLEIPGESQTAQMGEFFYFLLGSVITLSGLYLGTRPLQLDVDTDSLPWGSKQ